MFRYSIRELFLVTAVVALVAGWWVEHRRQTKASEEAAFLEWKNRVLETSLKGKGVTVQVDGASVMLIGPEGTSVVTPTSHVYNGKDGTRATITDIAPKGGKAPAYYYPPAPTPSPSLSSR